MQRVPEHDGSRRVSANPVALSLRRRKGNSELRFQARSVARGCPSKQSRPAELKGEEEKEGSARVAEVQLAALTLPKEAGRPEVSLSVRKRYFWTTCWLLCRLGSVQNLTTEQPKGAESVRHARSRASSVLSIKRATLSAKITKIQRLGSFFPADSDRISRKYGPLRCIN